MNTAPAGRCQCARRPSFRAVGRRGAALFCAGLLAWSAGAAAADEPPPPWRRDLAAAQILQAALAANPAPGEEQRQKLAQVYRDLLARYPDQAEVQRAGAVFYDSINEDDQALSCWQHAAALAPRDAATADALGGQWLRRGRIKEAAAQFDRAVDNQPDVAGYHADLANVLFLFRRELLDPPARPDEQAVLREALMHFRRAAELSPGSLPTARAYAETFYVFAHPDWEEALAAWKTVLRLSGTETDFANGHLARISLRLHRPDDAAGYLDQIRSPAFDSMKDKLRRQVDAMRSPVSPVPGAPAEPQ